MKKTIALAIALPMLAGCFNLATRPAEITGTYTSPLQYAQYTCDQLASEVASLARRENALVAAQNQRRKSGKVQAFWLGYGTGDGIEASELASVRGEKEAARAAMDQKHCATAAYATPAAGTAQPVAAPHTIPASESWRTTGGTDPAKTVPPRP